MIPEQTPTPVPTHFLSGHLSASTSTPTPVDVIDLPSPGPLAWATFAIAAASFVAASIAAWEALVTLRMLARKSLLTATFPVVSKALPQGYKAGFDVGCNVVNKGNRGLRDFRVTYAFSPQCNIVAAALSSKFAFSIGQTTIDGQTWDTLEFQQVGPIYAPDDLWVATIRVGLPHDSGFQIRWHVDTEDGRIPANGWSSAQTLP